MSIQTFETFTLAKDQLLAGIDKAIADYKVAALTKKGERILYDYISSSKEIEFTYKPTVLSPKKFFFPQEEVILEYTADGKVTNKIEAEPRVLFGIRPCDLNGFKILNEAFAESNGDPNYLAKMENSIIIGMDCKRECDENAFCYKVKANYARQGFDVMLYEVGDKYALEIATKKGNDFVNKYFNITKGGQDLIEQFAKEKQQAFADKKPFKQLEKFPELFEQHKHHSVWEQEGSRCLSCGSCIMVCPTCYCFDVADELAVNLQKGARIRKWDACMLSSFAVVAGNENFRKDKVARLHHRINRKFNYLMTKHNQAVCVGCGRCVRACLVSISPKTIAEKITEEEGGKA